MTLQNSEWKSMFGSNESDSSNASLSPKARTLQKTAESLEKKLNTSQTMSQTSSSSGSFVTMSQSQVSSEGSIRSVTEKGSEKNPISELACLSPSDYCSCIHVYCTTSGDLMLLNCMIHSLPQPFFYMTQLFFDCPRRISPPKNLSVASREQNL